MTDDDSTQADAAVGRRTLFRGGAMLTGLTIGAAVGGGEAALALTNADGPSLTSTRWPKTGTTHSPPARSPTPRWAPLIGVVQDGENRNAALLTDQDVWIPFALQQPVRLVDTRTVSGRERVTVPPSPATGDCPPADR
jgi:hypothetical protein